MLKREARASESRTNDLTANFSIKVEVKGTTVVSGSLINIDKYHPFGITAPS